MRKTSLLKTAKQIFKRFINVTTAAIIGLSGLAAAAPLFIASSASAATLDVCPSGCTYSSIQAAVTAASTNDTISVGQGTYSEVVSISNKNLTLLGAGSSESTVTAFNITNANVTINGFTINPGTSNSGVGLQFSGGTSETVQNNIITNYGYNSAASQGTEGVSVAGTSGLLFQYNVLTSPTATGQTQDSSAAAQDGIFFGSGASNNVQILNNTFANASTYPGTDIGLSYTSGTNPVISGNTSTGGATLVTIFNSTGAQITNNSFISDPNVTDTGSVIYIGGGDTNTTVNGNTASGGYFGVALRNVYGDGPNTGIIITGNNLANNYGGGISASGTAIASTETVIAHNNDLSNNPLGVSNTTSGSINATSNYWGTAVPATITSLISGSGVTYTPYYVSSAGVLDGTGTLNTAVPSTVYVGSGYTDGSAGGHVFGYDAFSTIQTGVNAVASGGTVNVAAGTYNENVIITQPVTLLGSNATVDPNTGTRSSEATINGGDGFAITLESPNVTISGFTIAANADGEGIYNIDADTPGHDISGVNITDNIFSGSSRAVALESNASSGTVKINDNLFDGADKDLAVADNSFNDLQIEGNVFNEPANDDEPVQIGPDGTGTISSFEFEDNQTYGNVNIGANVEGATVNGNTFNAGSLAGGDVEFQAALHNSSTVSGNTFNGGTTYSCLQLFGSQYGLVPSNGVTVSGNTFTDCGNLASSPYNYAIQLSQDVNDITITGNTITNAYDGISTRTGSGWTLNSDIHINYNNITGSTDLAVNNTVTGTLDATDNYWGVTNPSSLISENVNYAPWYLDSGYSISSTGASLNSLSLSSGTLSPTFSAGTTSYSVGTVSNSTSSVTISSTYSTGASITINGTSNPTVSMAVGANTVTVKVTSADGTASQTYTITVNRAAATQTLPNSGGNATLNSSTPQVVVTSSSQPITVTVTSGTTDASVNFSALVTSGTTTSTATLPQTTINSSTADVTIPASTTVTANTPNWDGVINAPSVQSNSSVTIPTSTGTINTIGTVINIGADNGISLTFSNAVRLLIPGQAGQLVGFVRNGTFTQISTACSADSQAAGDALPAGGDCYISVGSDMVVWTKHFTEFVTYTKSNSYTVQAGDTMSGIAQKVGLTLAELEKLNPQAGHPAGNFSLILPGDVLNIGGAVVTASATSSGTGTSASSSSGQVLGANTTSPSTGQILGTSTTKPSTSPTKTSKKSTSGKFLGLGWWWIPIILVVIGSIYYVYRSANTDEQSTSGGKK